MAGELITSEWQVEWNGYLVGAGQPWKFVGPDSIEGIHDLPDVRVSDVPRGRAHGSVPGPQYSGDRTITIPLVPSPGTNLPAAAEALSAAMVLQESTVEQPLVWRLDGDQNRQVNARVRRRSIPVASGWQFGHTVATIQWVATDPRIYAAGIAEDLTDSGLHTVQTSAGTVTGGLGFSHGFPHGFGTASTGLMAVRNNGATPAPWTATLKGPMSGPRIDLVGTTGVLALDNFDLLDGDTLELDSKNRTVLLNGTASRYGSLTQAEWFDLPVGPAQVQLTAAGGGSHSDAQVLQWRDSWL